MTTTQPPTVEGLKKLAADTVPAVRAVLLAQAYAELKRQQVDAYIQPIFDRYRFEVRPEWRHEGRPVAIATPHDLYLSDDEPGAAAFYKDCDDEHRRHGFDGPPGHCPALVAEHLLMRAEQLLIELTAPFFGIEEGRLYGEHRRKFLDLIIGAGIQAATDAGINLAAMP